MFLAALSVITLAAVGLAVTGLVSTSNSKSSASHEANQLSLQVAHQKVMLTATSRQLAADSRQLAADNKQLGSIQTDLAAIGHADSTTRLGVCLSTNVDSSTGDLLSVNWASPVLTDNVASCQSGAFVSAAPVSGSGG
jgi:hypothetical protein